MTAGASSGTPTTTAAKGRNWPATPTPPFSSTGWSWNGWCALKAWWSAWTRPKATPTSTAARWIPGSAPGPAPKARSYRGGAPWWPTPPNTARNSCSTHRARSEEHTSELQSHHDLVCRLLLEKKKTQKKKKNKKKKKKERKERRAIMAK